MNNFSQRLIRGLFVLVLLFCGAYVGLHGLRQTGWYKHRLYAQLLAGSPQQRLLAAASLAQLGAEQQLLAALQTDQAEARETARRALEYLWFNAAGAEAFRLLHQAHEATEQEDPGKALEILDRLTARFPRYAEGWNRRAAVYWELGQASRSMADCERALALNPHHYGAWQGLGLGRLQQGDVTGACQCLRAALRIIPHDAATREALRRCEDLLRLRPAPDQRPPEAVMT